MMREPLTLTEMHVQLERLNTVFAKYGVPDLKQAVPGYFDALRDLDKELVLAAVTLAMRTEKRFPPPAVLIEHGKAWKQANRPQLMASQAAESADPNAPVCRHCGVRPRLAWLEGTVYDGTAKPGTPRETFQLKRYIAPCFPERHTGTGFIPYPPNFLGWAD